MKTRSNRHAADKPPQARPSPPAGATDADDYRTADRSTAESKANRQAGDGNRQPDDAADVIDTLRRNVGRLSSSRQDFIRSLLEQYYFNRQLSPKQWHHARMTVEYLEDFLIDTVIPDAANDDDDSDTLPWE